LVTHILRRVWDSSYAIQAETAFPFSVFPLQEHDISRKQDRTVDRYPAGTPYSTNIFFVNADMTETARKSLNPSVYDHHYNIGVWNWELSTFPVRWQSCFDAYNELWVASTFIRDALAVHTTKPVTAVPITIHVDVDKSITRAHLGLPEHEFIILFAFDALSIIERKNPMAVIRAFEQAFTESERQGKVRLVIKVNNLNLFNEESRQIEAAMKRINGILINSYLSRLEVHALYNHCNAYISLHRSEGYGLTLAETMFLGKPVVATGYSGNMDFMNPNNSYIVPYTLVELEREYTPYETGNVWADPDIESAAYILRQIYENYEDAKARGANAAAFMREHNDRRVVGEFLAFQLELMIKAQNTAAKS
jgi:glycosyltransferase involved in cell wall biosynthesis